MVTAVVVWIAGAGAESGDMFIASGSSLELWEVIYRPFRCDQKGSLNWIVICSYLDCSDCGISGGDLEKGGGDLNTEEVLIYNSPLSINDLHSPFPAAKACHDLPYVKTSLLITSVTVDKVGRLPDLHTYHWHML